VADGDGADSILQFRLERGDDRIKYCRKIKWRQRARLGSMGRKRDTVNLARQKNKENLCG
jgi:hypothetical protein